MKRGKLCLCAVMFLAITGYGGKAETYPGEAMLAAYAEMQYSQAGKLADEHPDLIEARLVKALCAVFDRRSQDLDYGMSALKKIYEDKQLNAGIRAQAGLSYARAAQTLLMREGVYPPAKNIDFNKIYDDLIAQFPALPVAVFAAIYQSEGRFDSDDPEEVGKGFSSLNAMLKNFHGPKTYLSPIHYMLAEEYIIHGKRYDLAVTHLEAARDIGIANPRNREQVIFRIARIYDLHLHNRVAAEINYQRFLREFPNASAVPVARRFLDNLKSGKKEAGNGGA